MLEFPYRGTVGTIMWTATMTRPDIACALRAVARLRKNPGLAHYKKTVIQGIYNLLHTNEWESTFGEQG